MTATEYKVSEEWRKAETAMATILGFRVKLVAGAIEHRGTKAERKYPDSYQLINIDADGSVKSVQPVVKQAYEAWCEAVRMRIETMSACALAWRLYAAATGVTINTFNGMPPGEPEEHVKEERQRLIASAEEANKALRDLQQLLSTREGGNGASTARVD